ncbi:unnamed protein product [Polarella glacialis]|uniref:AB hydrolase-1 domain-containing protein n=1 Tax=Polarella glacialis TaxID=89957 RepID=A0A813J6K6_POLGL|nr:unnamed protein product [Polarella glacialis]
MAPGDSDIESKGLLGGGKVAGSKGPGCCCAYVCCGIVVVLLLVVFGVYKYLTDFLTEKAINQFITLHDTQVHEACEEPNNMMNLASKIWWPGCGQKWAENKTCGEPCYSKEWMQSIIDFDQNEDPGKIVAYKNRPGDYTLERQDYDVQNLTLRGWLLKAAEDAPETGSPRPRIALQHGFTSNSNKFRQITMAVILRQLGFDVLVNNFRDHCYSDDSKSRVVEWGDAYPYDLLGAYLVKDPHGHLGGEVDNSKVGIVGISMGAFTTVNAFTMAKEVPAAWADAPPASPGDVFSFGALLEMYDLIPIPKPMVDILHKLLIPGVWKTVENTSAAKGVNLNEHLPKKTIPTGPDTKRPFGLVGNSQDRTVPFQNIIDIATMAKKYPKKYDVTQYTAHTTCNDRTHCVDHVSQFKEYKAKLCLFWYPVFGIDTDRCPEDVDKPQMH